MDQDTARQTQWLEQINRTVSAGEQSLTSALAKQQRRFYWIAGIALGVCLLAVIGLVIGIVLLTR
jgi:hypothetical protein